MKTLFVILFSIPLWGSAQCDQDSIRVLLKSDSLIALIKPCPQYNGTAMKNGNYELNIGKAGKLSFLDLVNRYAISLRNGEVKLYTKDSILDCYALIENHNIKLFQSYYNDQKLMSEQIYLQGDSVFTINVNYDNEIKQISEYVSPDSVHTTNWRQDGSLFYISKTWNLKADTISSINLNFDQRGNFRHGEMILSYFDKITVQLIEIKRYEIDENEERIK